jgi:dynein heavy chain
MYKGNRLGIARMWAHECHRTWLDRLIKPEDVKAYDGFVKEGIRAFGDIKEDDILAEPLIFTSYVASCEGHDPTYLDIMAKQTADKTAIEHLKEILEAKLEEYNEQIAKMDLVLFTDAMKHISRIARIIGLPCGNALLVGVGGSGKQSLSKLSAFILTYDPVRITVTSSYGMGDLKTDIQSFYQKAGVTGQ